MTQISDDSHPRLQSPPISIFGILLLTGALLLGHPALGEPSVRGAGARKAALGGAWQDQGPGPNTLGQVEGIQDGEVVGAIHTAAPHPTNADILYAGAVNGGIWRTDNATDASPTWVQQSDSQASLSIGAMEFDPTDATAQTLLAGIGRYSSFGRLGGSRIGLLRTTDGGTNWIPLDGGGCADRPQHFGGGSARRDPGGLGRHHGTPSR